MTTFPKAQAVRAPAAIAKAGRETTRAHARLDQVESTTSLQSTQIATGASNLTALENLLGGTAQETYLGSLSPMAYIGNASPSGVGTLSTVSGTVTAGELNTVINSYNSLNNVYRDLVSRFNSLLAQAQTGNFMNS